MHWFNWWWSHEVVHGGKGPLLLALIAFVVTFLVTRIITRLIRAGIGPFGNINIDGVHLHHSTPGVVMVIGGGLTAVGAPTLSAWAYLAAFAVGSGSALVLDEFAMIFRLRDVYWSEEGQMSIGAATLAAACLCLAVVGLSPASVPGLSGAVLWIRYALMVFLALNLTAVAVVALKGKYPTAVVGVFVAPVAWIAAIRLARPTSLWARLRYDEHQRSLARRRLDRFDRRWGPIQRWWADLIGGRPTRLDHPPEEN